MHEYKRKRGIWGLRSLKERAALIWAGEGGEKHLWDVWRSNHYECGESYTGSEIASAVGKWPCLSQRNLNKWLLEHMEGFPGGSVVKNQPAMQEPQETRVQSLGQGRSPGGGHGNPLPVFLPGESHGQRSLVGYSPQGCKESDMTKWRSTAHTKGAGLETCAAEGPTLITFYSVYKRGRRQKNSQSRSLERTENYTHILDYTIGTDEAYFIKLCWITKCVSRLDQIKRWE